ITYAEGFVMPIMICLIVATGAVSIGAAVAEAGVAARAVRSPAMMNAMPLMNSATLTANSQYIVFIVLSAQSLKMAPLPNRKRCRSFGSRQLCATGNEKMVNI